MKTKIKEAFDEIRAEDQLKNKTREFLYREMRNQPEMMQSPGDEQNQPKTAQSPGDEQNQPKTTQSPGNEQNVKGIGRWRYGKWLSAVACFFFLVLAAAGYQFYFSATAVISIDVNPSIELNINRFDTVISVKAYNEDGQALAERLQIRFMKYMDAFRTIMNSDDFASYRSEEDFVSVAVAGYNEEQEQKILSDMEACASQEKNMHCYHADEEEISAAHEEGLSCGKYRAYLELQKLDPDITVDEVKEMTMREIRDRIEALSSGQAGTDPADNGTEQESTDSLSGGWRYRGGKDGSGQGHHHDHHHDE